ncbi:hypothetical protein DIE19_03050 [Burkholderia sp. Bp9126]|nr:hypothetical protein DIE19_03050 [Burkholderia sp. Bp9126]
MKEMKIVALAPPRFEVSEKLLIAGLSNRLTFDTNEGIPALWQAFIPYIGNLPDQVDDVTYGVCCNPDADGNGWLPNSRFKAADAPEFERYSEDFDPVAGTGVLEIWVPIEGEAGRSD